VVLVLLSGLFTTFLGWAGAGHEYFHGTAFPSGRFNLFLFRLFSAINWNNWGWFEVSHLLHHKNTMHNLDPESPPLKVLSRTRIFWLLTIDFPTMFRRIRILLVNIVGRSPIKNEELRNVILSKPNFKRRISQGSASVLLFQIFVFLLLFQLNVILAIIFSISPFTFTFINKIVEINQHFQMQVHALDFRLNSRTVKFNKFIEFLYANMNYHAEHHMFPGVPYYNLPKLNDYLLEAKMIEKPNFGLFFALRTARNRMGHPMDTLDCLSCPLSCSKPPTKI
jgi:fatty acid desaturase